MSKRREYLGVLATGLTGAVTGCLGGEGDSPTAAGTESDTTATDTEITETGTAERTEPEPDRPLEGSMTITGSSTVYPVVSYLAQRFHNQNPRVNISVSPTGTGGGFSNHFCVGNADFNAASRPISGDERQQCSSGGVEYHEMRIATDAVTVVVNTDNDWVDCVTTDQLRELWRTDGATTWADVDSGWPDEEIQRYGPADTSGTFDYFTEAVVGDDATHTSHYAATERDNHIIQGVQSEAYAIGYLGLAYYQRNQERVNALAIDDGHGCVEPALETARDGEYQPLTRPLFTYVNTARLDEAHVAEFARYLVEESADSELIAEQIGYVPNTEAEMQAELSALNEAVDDARADGNE